MYSFASDYLEGAHPRIMEALSRTNMDQTVGYEEDEYCREAERRIIAHINSPSSRVYFLVGGTQTNCIFIASALRPHQAVIAAATGHISVHESGGVEATGHKVISLPCHADGKLSAAMVDEYIADHYADETHEHIAQPSMVYISQPTEVGTMYSKAELTALHEVCVKWGILLYADGARLGYALAAPENDVTLPDIAALTDAFYIGGTKVGTLFGEALVINNVSLQKDFRYIQKQRGALFAKGRLMGVQFGELFGDDLLYVSIASHAITMTRKLSDGIRALGYDFLAPSNTNQLFPILPTRVLIALSDEFSYSPWKHIDAEYDAVRFCTSWATVPEQVDKLLIRLRELSR